MKKMKDSFVRYSKGQLKVQQMAFVLVAFALFFGMAALFYFSFGLGNLKSSANDLRHEQAQETVRKMSASPEFSWTLDDCVNCVDMDKVFSLKSIQSYSGFWGPNVGLLQVKQVYPSNNISIECTRSNYPNCNSITLVNKPSNFTSEEAFVALCKFDSINLGTKCALGKIVMGVKST